MFTYTHNIFDKTENKFMISITIFPLGGTPGLAHAHNQRFMVPDDGAHIIFMDLLPYGLFIV